MKPSWTSPWRGIYTSQELSAVFQVFPSHYLGFKRLLGIYFPLLQRSSYLTLSKLLPKLTPFLDHPHLLTLHDTISAYWHGACSAPNQTSSSHLPLAHENTVLFAYMTPEKLCFPLWHFHVLCGALHTVIKGSRIECLYLNVLYSLQIIPNASETKSK